MLHTICWGYPNDSRSKRDTPALFLVVASPIPPLLPPPLPSCEIILFFSPPPDAETKGEEGRKGEKRNRRARGHHSLVLKSHFRVYLSVVQISLSKEGRGVGAKEGKKLIFVSSPFAIGGANHLEKEVRVNFPGLLLRSERRWTFEGEISVSSCRGYTHSNGMCLKM